jgi:phage gp29-like protein
VTVEITNVRPARIGRSYALSTLTIPAPYHDRDVAMLGNQLTPASLTSLIYERNTGDLQGWIDLANEARCKDPHLHSQLAIREQSVVETDFCVLPGKDASRKGNIVASRKAVTACEQLYEYWRTRPYAGWERWVAEIVGGNYYGRSLHEVMWDRTEGETRPIHLEEVKGRRLSYACDLNDPNPWALRIWDKNDPYSPFGRFYGIPLSEFHPDKFLINEPRVAGGNQAEEGLFAVVVWYWLFRTWSWRDLMALAEMLGRPPVVAYYAAGGARMGKENEFGGSRNATSAEITAANKTVKQLTGAMRSVLPDTIRIDPLKFSLPTSDPLQLLSSREIDAMQSKAINGVANLSDLKAGARAAVEAQERTSYTFWRSDCRNVARLISWLFERYIRANPDKFGETCPAPILKAKTDPPKDRKAVLEAIAEAQGVGMKVSKAWAHSETDIPEPPEDAKPGDILEPPAPKPIAAPPPDDNADKPDEVPPDETAAKE